MSSEPGQVQGGCASLGALVKGIALKPYSVLRFQGQDLEGSATYRATEGRSAEVLVDRVGDLASHISAGWETSSSDPKLDGLHGSIVFNRSESRATASIPIPNDSSVNGTRKMIVMLNALGSEEWVVGGPAVASVQVVDDDLRGRWLKPRGRSPFHALLRRGRLALPYRCSHACGYWAKLRVSGASPKPLAEARIRTAKSAHGVAVFRLGPGGKTAIRHALSPNGLRLSVRGKFWRNVPSFQPGVEGEVKFVRARIRLRLHRGHSG